MGRRRSGPKTHTGLFVVIAVIIAAAAAGFWIARTPSPPTMPPKPKPTASMPGAQPPAGQQRRVDIYIVKIVENKARLIPVARYIPAGAEPHKAALEKLLATNRQKGDSQSLVPIGTKLLSFDVRDGIAYANFSKEIKDNFPGGSMNEALLVNSIIHTLTEFSDVDRVQILVDGKRIETIGGHLDISQPEVGDSTLLYNGETE